MKHKLRFILFHFSKISTNADVSTTSVVTARSRRLDHGLGWAASGRTPARLQLYFQNPSGQIFGLTIINVIGVILKWRHAHRRSRFIFCDNGTLGVVHKWRQGLMGRGSRISWRQYKGLSNKPRDDVGRGSKVLQNCVTSFMDDPLPCVFNKS